MHPANFFEDRLSPRRSLSAEDHARLTGQLDGTLARMWGDLLTVLGLDEDARWREATGRDERGWLAAERERFQLWRATGGSVQAARSAWTDLTRRDFVRHLIAGGRIGQGDRDA